MLHNDDISHILKSWPFNEHDVTVRLIRGDDGLQKVQMRIDLGVLQMELDGRPDGKRPRKKESYLQYFEDKVIRREDPSSFVLSPMDCFKLQQEAIQYYHRYLALMKLKDYFRVSRDTSRNLRVFDFVEKYAENDDIVWQFIQHRPYVIMMNTRANASAELDRSKFDEAINLIQNAISRIEEYHAKWQGRLGSDSPELEFLNYWMDEISEKKPMSEEELLSKELDKAVREENYEKAAELRDRLAELDLK
jgi:hypothetical protein